MFNPQKLKIQID
jgi:hypothetical protein